MGPESSVFKLPMSFSSLELVNRVDTYGDFRFIWNILLIFLSWLHYCQDPEKYKTVMKDFHCFMIEGYNKPFGYVYHEFVDLMNWPSCWEIDREKRFLILKNWDELQRT